MPTLNFLSPGAALPMPIALNPIAAVPAGEGDAFAAMLAGLSATPVGEGVIPQTPPGMTLPTGTTPSTGAPLPRVRQDPAAWLPGAEDVPPELGRPTLTAWPTPAQLETGPDCEMPAFDLALPQIEDAPETPAAPPAALQTIPKFWHLRLSSALTPSRVTPKAPDGEIAPPPNLERTDDKASPIVAAPPPEPNKIDTPVDRPQPVVVAAPVQPTPQAPVSATVQPSSQTPDAIASGPAGATSVAEARRAPAAAPAMEAVVARAAPPAELASTLSHADQQPSSGQQFAGQRQPETAAPREPLAPAVARQVERVMETIQAKADPVAVAAPIAAANIPAPAPQAQAAIAPTPSPPASPAYQPAPVDLGRAEWVQAMVDRIAELPQAEGRREAQIQLLPDALGKVEVRIVERDERMQVTFNADNAQARQLLSDAAPRLQELAEARGLRFAEPQVGGGQSQDRRPAQDQQQPQTPQRPRPASAGRNADSQPQGDLIA